MNDLTSFTQHINASVQQLVDDDTLSLDAEQEEDLQEIQKSTARLESLLIKGQSFPATDLPPHFHHDLRSPINVILGFSEILMDEAPLTQEQSTVLAAIHTQAEQLLIQIDAQYN